MILVSPLAEADEARWTSLAIYPPETALTTSGDFQNVVVVATRDDGVTQDVSTAAELAIAQSNVVSLAGCTLRPAADGQTELVATFADLQVRAPITVSRVSEARQVSFMLDAMPVFARAGCNSGSCHGAAIGKDGFRLSLFGFDPRGDHYRITREQATRRINLALPSESLLLQKATGAVQHTGGKRFDAASDYYTALHDWLAAGAVSDADSAPSVASLAIYPPAVVMQGEQSTQQFLALATYSDGTTRDVTQLATFSSNNDSSALIDAQGLVSSAARGEAFVMARFDVHLAGSQVLVLPTESEASSSDLPAANYIDELVNAKLKKMRLEPSPPCSDEEFLRRVTIDILGLLPTAEQHGAFLADPLPDKRAKKIDELLARKEFSEIWAMKWAELLMVKTLTNRVEYKPMFLYASWLAQQIADEVPLSEMVRFLLGASGGTFSVPATNFYQLEPDPRKTAENVAQVFLGVRIQCAQCHNHPFDRWTMDDYYGFNAFFSQIGRKQGEDYRETIVFNRRGGEVKHPVGGQVMRPKFLGGEQPEVGGNDRRQVLADWLTDAENPFFARSIANRVWAHYLGVGVVDPVDDIRISNPASNPQLLDALGQKLIEYDYNLKRLVRDICNSHAYQRSTEPNASNAGDTKNFARAQVRRIQAEMLLDCISQVTETKDKFRGLPRGARAVQIADGNTSTHFLTTFGRAKRNTVAACEVDTSPTLSQALHLINGAVVEKKIREGKVIEKLLDNELSPSEVVAQLTIRCYGRSPDEQELAKLQELLGETERPVAALQDTFWALLNSREFLFNH